MQRVVLTLVRAKSLELMKRLINYRKVRLRYLLLLILLAIILALFFSDKVMIEIPKYYAGQISSKTNLDLLPLWQRITGKLFRFEDDINLFTFKKNLMDGTFPVYDLELRPGDLVHLDNLSEVAVKSGYMPEELNSWREAALFVDGKHHKVKIRYRGDAPAHWAYQLKSFLINTQNTDYIDRMERYGLIIFEDRKFTPLIGAKVAKDLGLMDIRNGLDVLRINGVVQGLYYLEEKLGQDWLEYNNCSSCYVLSLTDNWVTDHKYDIYPHISADPNGVFWETGHRTAFDYELANVAADNVTGIRNVMYRVDQLYDAVKNKKSNIMDFFDKDQLSSFQAFRMITGNLHVIAGDNFRLVYKATNSKFYPAPLIEASTRLKLQKGGLYHYLSTFGKPVDLFYLIAKDDELRYMTHKKVYTYILNNDIIESYDKIVQEYGPHALSYKTNSLNRRFMKYEFKEQREVLQYNMNLIKRNLDYSKFYAKLIEKDNYIDVEIIPDSIAELKFNKFVINLEQGYKGRVTVNIVKPDDSTIVKTLMVNNIKSIDLLSTVKDIYLSAGLDDNLYPEIRRYPIRIIFDDAMKIDLSEVYLEMRNDINNKDIPKEDAYIQIANANDFYENSEHQSFEQFKQNYPNLKLSYDDGNLILLEGDYNITSNMIVPKFKSFNIQAGTKLRIAKDTSILSYSSISVRGTADKPVVITSINKNEPFGSFAVVGQDSDDSAIINWLDISNGNEAWINGMYFSGQMSIHHVSNVRISNSAFHNGHADDGINVKYANILVEDSRFYNNAVDQFDMDFVQGVVKKSLFDGISSNGDGLDLSGSKLIVKNSEFVHNKDKGISIGEGTKINVYNNELFDNNIGTAVKDLSYGYYIGNTFRGNDIAVDVYQKKQLFGSGTAYVYKNNFIQNKKDMQKDNQSVIYDIKIDTADINRLKINAEKEIIEFPD